MDYGLSFFCACSTGSKASDDLAFPRFLLGGCTISITFLSFGTLPEKYINSDLLDEARNPVPICYLLLIVLLQVSSLVCRLGREQFNSDPLVFNLNRRLFLEVSPLHREPLRICPIFNFLNLID